MSDLRTHVTANPRHPNRVIVIIDGPSCSTFNALTRDEARVLAAQITQHLDETEGS